MGETNDGGDVRLPDGPVRFHPLCEAFPAAPEHELQRLAKSIKTNGLREPIVLAPDGSILDGRNRFICCERVSVEPRFRPWREEADGPLLQFVLDKNARRRQLTPAQRALVAARLADMKRGTRTDLASAEAMSDAEAAEAIGVSESSVERAKATLREAHPSVVAMLEHGDISVTTVLQAVRAEPDVAIQAKWSAADAKEVAKRARASARHGLADATGTEEPETKPAGGLGTSRSRGLSNSARSARRSATHQSHSEPLPATLTAELRPQGCRGKASSLPRPTFTPRRPDQTVWVSTAMMTTSRP